jgi:hypothetical protein
MEKFSRGKPQPRRTAMAETGGSPVRANGKQRTWADLTPDAQSALDGMIASNENFQRMGVEKARQQILANAEPSHFRR